jgi:peptide/nickel transport system substrate-binding protein
MKKKLIFTSCLTVLLLMLLLPACSNTTPTATTSAPPAVTSKPTTATAAAPSPTAATTAVATTPTTVTASKPATTAPAATTTSGNQRLGGTLKIALISDATNLGDPGEITSQGRAMMKPCIEQLGRMDLSGQVAPWLADSWQTDDKALTLTVKLKQGIKFQDGTPFNAAAVKWNWDYQIGAKVGNFRNVKSVDVIDDNTVRANLSGWDNAIVYKLVNRGGSIVSPTSWQTNGAAYGQTHPVGTGPFVFVSWTKGVSVIYKRWDGYWQKGKPYLDGVQFQIIADETTRSMTLQSRGIDVILQSSPLQSNDFKASGKYKMEELTQGIPTRIYVMVPSSANANSPLAKASVRQAIEYAIDKKSMVDSLFRGYGAAVNGFCLPTNWANSPNVKGHPFNTATAKQMLASAGYPNGFSTTIYVDPQTQDAGIAVAGMLTDAGIKAQAVPTSRAAMMELFSKGWEGWLFVNQDPGGDTPAAMVNYYHTGGNPAYVSMVHSAEIDSYLDAAISAPDASKQATTWKSQEFLFNQLSHVIPLCVETQVTTTLPQVRDDKFSSTCGEEWTPEDCWISQ